MSKERFFQEQKGQSAVKSAIVSKYFVAWATVITRVVATGPIQYIDLFAGPGRYDDATKSTPVMVLESIIADSTLRKRVRTIFNDRDEDYVKSLTETIEKIPGIDKLKYQPGILNDHVDDEMAKAFKSRELHPTLSFVDPWGYKGLSLNLVRALIKDFASECIFFFNYNRINMGIPNPIVNEHMASLFEHDRLENLMSDIRFEDPAKRELLVLNALCEALGSEDGRFVLPFRFRTSGGKRTSHHLIFVSKHKLGYDIMKKVMVNESSSKIDGVGSFEYNPSIADYPILFNFARPLEDLKGLILVEYAGRSLTVQELFDDHNVGYPYILRNYQAAVVELENEGLVTTDRSPRNRKSCECPPRINIQFPEN